MISSIHKRWWPLVFFVLVVPTFLLCFLLLFNPYDVQSFYSSGAGSFTLNILMLFCIALAVLAVTRLVFHFICGLEKVKMSWFWYAVWCVAEVMVIAQFHTLYTSLMLHLPYLNALDDCLKIDYTILIFPYVILTLGYELQEAVSAPAGKVEQDDSLLRFHDENQKLKLVIAPSAVLYLQSEENYVRIHFIESEKLKNYVLRNSMKSLEEVLSSHGFVRCHRSYVVNPKHIKMLKKEAEGVILAELDAAGASQIPVSKRYYEKISEIL